ncbi:hypothetical protein HNR39_000853 [Glaciimonas immobilis]|uniref:Uncharacterized protein n=1 Tax=Glaciimonas immobilis TaxID=728004 RepID=A0A840RMQ5_9BURK|nr:hypothetical protein [Glaciimonas immobilis]
MMGNRRILQRLYELPELLRLAEFYFIFLLYLC